MNKEDEIFEKKLKEIFKEEIEIPYHTQNAIRKSLSNIKEKKPKNKFKLSGFKIISTTCACLTLMVGVVFAKDISNWIKNVEFKQKIDSVNEVDVYNNIIKYMKYDGIASYYQEILTYDDYCIAKENFGEITVMSKEEFENNCLILIANLGDGTTNLEISNVELNNNELCIYLEQSTVKTEPNDKLISIKIKKEMYNKNIKIKINNSNSKKYNMPNISSYTALFTKEEAISLGYIVIYNEHIISNDTEAIDKFIESTNNGNEGMIRIFSYNDLYNDCYTISDVSFINNEYELCQLEIGDGAEFKSPRTYRCKNLTKIETSNKRKRYCLEDKDGYNNRLYNICSTY